MSPGCELAMFSESADYYDLIYRQFKGYRAESQRLAEIIRGRAPAAATILDVACGTGEHARWLRGLGFKVDGVDLEPRFLELAQGKNPEGRFFCQDMAELRLQRKYDVVMCLFSSIGYVRTEARLRRSIERFASHVAGDGLVVVEPWFQPHEVQDRLVTIKTAEMEDVKICRMSRTILQGGVSRLEFEYLVGRGDGLEHLTEVHQLGLFTRAQVEQAFRDAGLVVEYDREGLCGRGLYVGRKSAPSGRATGRVGEEAP